MSADQHSRELQGSQSATMSASMSTSKSASKSTSAGSVAATELPIRGWFNKDLSATDRLKQRLERVIGWAEWCLWAERVWPPVLAAFFTGLGFLGVVWLGWLALLPDWARWAAILGTAFGLLGAVYMARQRALGTTHSGRDAAIARVERLSNLRHQPLSALNDQLSLPEMAGQADVNTQTSAETKALWAAHRARSLAQLDALKAGLPQPRFFALDRFALRVVAGLLFVCGAVTGQGHYLDRLVDVFALSSQDMRPLRVDIWADPPSYTNRAPIVLSYADRLSETPQNTTIRLPEGSELTVRIQGSRRLEPVFQLRQTGQLLSFERQTPSSRAPSLQMAGSPSHGESRAGDEIAPELSAATGEEPLTFKTVVAETGIFAIHRDDQQMAAWQLVIIADDAPTIALSDDPAVNLNQTIRYSYEMDDDYGIASAHAQYRPLNETLSADARPLIALPDHPLPLPASRSRIGGASTTRDLTDHPLAGATVEVLLSATDQAGQIGTAEPFVIDLPSRVFRKPIARALVDQRRHLALDARRQVRVLEALDALLMAPDVFTKDLGTYLGLRLVQRQLAAAHSDDALREVLTQMWDLALAIEDGDLSQAERNLRDAQEALRRALENGASDEEIAQLTENLRQAMQEYLQALAQNAQQQMGSPQQPLNGQEMQQSDLDRMLDQIQELAQSGARDAAQQMLSQLQQMLDNMRAAQQQQGGPGGQQNPLSEAMRELGDIIRQQRQLMDQTFQQQQGTQNQPGQQSQQGQQGQRGQQGQSGQQEGAPSPGDGQPMSPEQLAEALRQLQEQQNALSQRLQDLRDQLGDMGLGEEQGEAFGDAGDAMDRAEGALGDGAPGQAVGPQGQALDALRRGIDDLAEAMQSGPGGQQQAQPGGRGQPNQDPLGRPRRTEGPDFGEATKIPDEIDIQRARRVLQELRRRLSNPDRPQLELDYLERLLERF